MARQRRTVPYHTREQLAEAMRAAVLTNPSAAQHDGMARALNIAPRTLYRLRQKFLVPWPPFEDWTELLRLAGAGFDPAAAEPRPLTSWLVTYTIREQRWLTAASVEEAIAKLRAEIGPRAIIVSVQQA
jgi:hypothetical protein